VVGYVTVQPKYGGDVDDLEVGVEAVDGNHGPDGARGGGRSGVDGERALELGEESGEKTEAERASTEWRSREKAENAEMNPAGRKGSSSS
jgi:hypothetical protein